MLLFMHFMATTFWNVRKHASENSCGQIQCTSITTKHSYVESTATE